MRCTEQRVKPIAGQTQDALGALSHINCNNLGFNYLAMWWTLQEMTVAALVEKCNSERQRALEELQRSNDAAAATTAAQGALQGQALQGRIEELQACAQATVERDAEAARRAAFTTRCVLRRTMRRWRIMMPKLRLKRCAPQMCVADC